MADGKRPIAAEDLNRIHYVQDPQISPDGRFVAFVKVTPDPLERGYERNIWLFPLGDGEAFQLTRGDKDSRPSWSPDGRHLAFVSTRGDKPQVYLLPTNGVGGEARALTNTRNGAHSPAWSPDGTQLAYLAPGKRRRAKGRRLRKTAFPRRHLTSWKRNIERNERMKTSKCAGTRARCGAFPIGAGTAFVDERYDQIYVIDIDEVSESEARRLTDIAPITRSRAGPPMAPRYLHRAQPTQKATNLGGRRTCIALMRLPVKRRPMTDGAHSNYAPLPSPDGKWLAFGRVPIGVTDFPMRLLVMAVDGSDIRIVNEAIDREAVAWAWSQENQLAFTVESEGRTLPWIYGPCQRYFAPAARRPLRYRAIRHWRRRFDVHDRVHAAEPPGTSIFCGMGTSSKRADSTGTGWSEVIVQDARELRFQSPHGEIQGWYLLPVDYQPGQTYPLALNIHGGPHATWGYASKTMWHEWQFHAARGYAVFYCNPHGSGGYGEDFMRKLHAAWGPVAMNDIMAGVDAFLELGIADGKRMAITGGSYGGYMTAWIITHSDRFKVAVAQRGVYNITSFTAHRMCHC